MNGDALAPWQANGATLLFLGASISQLPAIEHAAALGYRVAAVDGDAQAPGLAVAHVSRAIDFSDVERVAEWARLVAVDGVLAISTDRGVVPAARLAAELGLPGLDVDVARRMTDKALMRRALASAGVRQPRHVVVRDPGDVQRALGTLERPFVLKPVDSGGQRGLFKVERAGDAARHLRDALAFSRTCSAIAEEFVEGLELNVLAAVRDGEVTLLTVSDRLRPAGIGFGVGWAHRFPCSLADETLEDVHETVVTAVSALGMRNGIAFPQLIAAADGVYVVEVAARIAAGQMSDLVRYGTGIDLYRIAFAQALGEPVADELVTPSYVRPIAIRFLTASPGVLPVGRLRSVAGMERVRASSGVLAAELYVRPGAVIRPLQVDADRSGYVIATGADPADALARADEASRQLEASTVGVPAARRRSRALAAVAAAVLVGTGAAIVLPGTAKLPPALVSAVHVDRVVAPLCRCSRSVAHLQFRLAHRTRVSVEVLTAGGRVAARVVRNRAVGPGLVRLGWSGRTLLGRALPDGSYVPAVVFPLLGRTVRLPARIAVDDGPRETAVLGRSEQGRPISVTSLGDPHAARRLLVVGCTHGNEPAGIAVARRLEHLRVPAGVAVDVVPDLNPDGVAAARRGNADGVDLNRNFPYRWRPLGGIFDSGSGPLSEPESRLAYRLVRVFRPTVSIWFHQHESAVDPSGGDPAVEARYARLVGLPLRRLGRYPGSATGWENHTRPRSTAFVVELPAGPLSAPQADRYARAALALVRGLAR